VNLVDQVKRRIPDYPAYYEAPAGDLLRLDQNANLLGANPAVLRAQIDLGQAHLYPSRDNTPLIEAAAKSFRVDPAAIFVGNGSDEILDIILRTLVEPGGRVVTPHPSYSLYGHLCRLARVKHVPVLLNPDFQLKAQALLDERPDLILIANPNNPTGTMLDARVIGQLLEGFDGPVVIDEAYAEFSGTSVLPLLGRFPNLLVTRTLSKAAGLAGLRVGLGFAHPVVADLIRRNKIPFSVNIVSEQLAIHALRHPQYIEKTVADLAKERDLLTAGLQKLGFGVVPSLANFVLTLPPIPSEELYLRLKESGILTRRFPSEPLLRDYIRFTVGRPQDNQQLLRTLQTILGQGGKK
jgi:histidinol-phosphate aminotransferase